MPLDFQLVIRSTLVGLDRASTTKSSWRSLFPEGVLLGSLDPTIVNDQIWSF